MAELNPRSGDRGQLLVVAAIGLAVLLVALALTLNTAVSGGIHAAGAGTGLQEERGAVQYQSSVERGVGGLIDALNGRYEEYDDLEAAFEAGLDEWHSLSGPEYARDGVATEASLVEATEGTLVVQENATRFTNRSGDSEWTLVGNASNVRQFRMRVHDENESLHRSEEPPGNETVAEESFAVRLEDDGGTEWRLYVYRRTNGPATVTVFTEVDGAVSDPCSVEADVVEIDLTAGTVGGERCSSLTFGEGLDPDSEYDVAYENADSVRGTYELTVAGASIDESHYGDDAPAVEPAIYSATISVEYRSSDLDYRTGIRVAPGETDG